jgi:hypothetical protein
MSLELKIGGIKNEGGEDKLVDEGKFIIYQQEKTLIAYFAGPNTFDSMKHKKVAYLFGIDPDNNQNIVGGAAYSWYGYGSLFINAGSCDFGNIPKRFALDLGGKLREYLAQKGVMIKDIESSTWRLNEEEIDKWNKLGYIKDKEE